MKLKKSRLREIIREELLNEKSYDIKVKARMIFLENDQYFLLDEETKKYIVNPNSNYSNIFEVEDSLEYIVPNKLKAGMYFIYRDSYTTDYIKEYADYLMGSNAVICRERLSKWKDALKQKASIEPTIQIALDLIECGGDSTVEEHNVRNWMSDDTIAPSNENNLLAILKYCDLVDEAETLIKNALYVRKMHRQAGQNIRHELMNSLKNMHFQELERSGTVTIGSEAIRNLIISRIVNISNEILDVSKGLINKPQVVNKTLNLFS